MKKITLKGGIACLAISILSLASCKKEEITSKKSVSSDQQTENHHYKFSKVVKIPGENPKNGFLSLKVSSDDEVFLKEYTSKLEQKTVVLREADPSEKFEPETSENASQSGVSLHFDWSHFNITQEKGKIYGVALANNNNDSKALTLLYSFSDCTSFTTAGAGYAAVNVYNKRSPGGSIWTFGNANVSDFYSRLMFYNDNFEIRTYTDSFDSGMGFNSFVVNGTTVYFRPRYNYSSPEMPLGYADYNAIKSGYGLDSQFKTFPAKANVAFYLGS
ncbi:hypothetical protein D3C87_262800 [compost metagenome]